MTPEAFWATLLEAAIGMGAGPAGTALTSFMQQVTGATVSRAVAEKMTQAGMLGKKEWHTDHGKVIVDASAQKRLGNVMGDPIAWIEGEGKEKIEAFAKQNGISTIAAVAQLFGRQTTQRLVAEALAAEPTFKRVREMFGDVPGFEDIYKRLQGEDLSTNIEGFEQAWKGLLEALGEPGIPLAIDALQSATGALHAFTSFAADHPTVIAALETAATGLAAAFVVMGTAATVGAIATFIPGGAAAVAITGLVAGIAGISTALVGSNWTTLWDTFMAPIRAIRGFLESLSSGAPADDGMPHPVPPGSWDEPLWKKFWRHMSYAPGGDAGGSVMLQGAVYFDGQRMGNFVAGSLANGLNRPNRGPSLPDLRAAPYSAAAGVSI